MNVLEIYEQAQLIADSELRMAFLASACAGNDALRARVVAMLGMAAIPEEFLGNAAVRGGETDAAGGTCPVGAPSPRPDAMVGAVVGGVRIERPVGHGGMGRVYAGTQSSTGGTVAVKVLMPHVVTGEMLKRCELEARLLARLRHHGIAQIYDAGTVEALGVTLPYFVMEYVADARPITDYADAHGLSTIQRVELFRMVCEAVAHGHDRGVIHRDLKPANILVDRNGTPKVIDFGVAKCIDTDNPMTTLTTEGGIAGTLKYMSPEQSTGDPAAITARSDVHALGVILYELLVGRMPFDFHDALPIGVAQIIMTQEPKPLSSVNRAFRGDLDAITAKCLEKDRKDRYASARELSVEIGRYLAGERILARPVGFYGELVRLARKHRAAATALAVIAASIVATVVGISAFAYRAERALATAREANQAEAMQRQVAIRNRWEAASAQQAAEKERANATAEGKQAKWELYVVNLYKVTAALDFPGRALGNELFTKTERLYGDVYGEKLPRPVELNAIAALLDDAIAVIQASAGGVEAVCYSPDGTRIATAGQDGTARLWDATTGELRAVLNGHQKRLTSVRFSPNGTQLATTSRDGTSRLWDVSTGATLAVLEGHEGPVQSARFSPDGTRLVTTSQDGTARMWDVEAGTALQIVKGHAVDELAACFSPDGKRLATTSGDTTARLWDVSTGDLQGVLDGHRLPLRSVAFSPDGERVVTTCEQEVRLWECSTGKSLAAVQSNGLANQSSRFSPDGTRLVTGDFSKVRIWDASTMKAIAVLEGHVETVSSASFSPDGARMATSSHDGTARLWDVSTGKSVAVLKGHTNWLTTVCFSPDGDRLATASHDGTVRLWDITATTSLATLEAQGGVLPCASFSPDGLRLATASLDFTKSARIWDVSTGSMLAEFEMESEHPFKNLADCFVAFSPDGERLATAAIDGTVRLRDASTGKILATLKGHKGPLRSVCFSPDGTRVATASGGDGTARLWEAATGQTVAVLEGHGIEVLVACFSPDGKRLATAGFAGPVRLWDGSTGESLTALSGHDDPVTAVGFSPDGKLLATAGFDCTARLFDVSTSELRAVLKGHERALLSVSFGPDGERLVVTSMDGTASIWDISTGTSLATLKGHQLAVCAASFSPDGKRLATAGRDGSIRLWDVSTGDELVVLKGHEVGSLAVCFSPDGKRLATASSDGTARLWGISNAEIYKSRLASTERRTRIATLVNGWFDADPTSVKDALGKAKATLPPGDWREASNMVLERVSSGQVTPPTSVRPALEPPPFTADGKIAGAVEGESLNVATKSAGTTGIQPMAGYTAARWSGVAQFYWIDAKPGCRLLLEVPVTVRGRYEVVAVCTKAPDYGVVKLSWNRGRPTRPLDLYHKGTVTITQEESLGTFDLEPGTATLAVEIVGENPAAEKRWVFGLDYVRFVPATPEP